MSASIVDGSAPTWRWAWGDGTTSTGGVQATHTYPSPGVYRVTLTIDDNGITGSADVGVVTVHPPSNGPQAAISVQMTSGSTVTFDASGSRGPGRQGGAIAE